MNETVWSFLDGYCERLGQIGLMAEPVNVITNLGFLVAAWLAWKEFRASNTLNVRNGWDVALLILVLGITCFGSGVWHIYAEQWALWFDVLPILIFINVYLLSFLIRVAGSRWWWALLLWGIFQIANWWSETHLPRETLNGSIMYAPAYITLILFTAYAWLTHHSQARRMVFVVLVFSLSIAFRTLDGVGGLCDVVPVGTHFLWHLLNAWMLYNLIRVLIDSHPRNRSAEESA